MYLKIDHRLKLQITTFRKKIGQNLQNPEWGKNKKYQLKLKIDNLALIEMNSQNSRVKYKQSNSEREKDMNRLSTKEEVQMANKFMKICATSLAIGKCNWHHNEISLHI